MDSSFNPTLENEHVFDWLYNGDSPISSKSSGSPLISCVESFDESLNNFIYGVNSYDPYFDSSIGSSIPPVYSHGQEVETYVQNINPGLTHSSSSNSVVDFNILHSFEELFPLLDEDLVLTHELNPDQQPNHVISTDQMINEEPGYVIIHEDHTKKQTATKKKAKKKYCNGKAVLIGFDEISKHFDVPITMAAKRLNVGLTALKKRCRELNIERWPHRKIQSLKTLIHNLKDEFGYCKELEMLEEHKKMMEKLPDMELTEETKKIRQACFKVNYKKRRSSSLASSSSTMLASSIYS